MKVALFHDYLNQMGGAERVVLAFHEIFPDAPIYTSIYDPRRVDPAFQKMESAHHLCKNSHGSPATTNHICHSTPLPWKA
jgi:hypothetical protein